MTPSERPAIRCEFRRSGYSDAEIQQLQEDLSEIANPQFRPQGIPAAGASFDIGIVVQWIGSAVAAGVLGNVAHDLLKALARKLQAFYNRKEDASGFAPDIYVLELRFDDFDLRIHGGDPELGGDCNFLRYETLANLPRIVQFVVDHAGKEPLRSAAPLIIDLHEPKISRSDSEPPILLFERPWRIEGVMKCDYYSYFPGEERLSGGYPNAEV